MDTTNLIAYLPFDDSATEDLCGNTWTAVGNPTVGTSGAIFNNALQLNGSNYLKMYGGITLGGQDFTIRGWAQMDATTTQSWGGLFALNGNNLRIIRYDTLNDTVEIGYKRGLAKVNLSFELTSRFFFELDYQHSTGKWFTFFNGVLVHTYTNSLERTTYSDVFVGGNGDNGSGGNKWSGSIDEFQIYDGVALHTENFTPPTEADYLSFTTTFDVQRKVHNDAKLAKCLKAYLPFDDSPTEDLCGNTWTAYGNPTVGATNAISGNALQLDGSSYLQMAESFAFAGQPFTVVCQFSGTSNTTGGSVCVWQMYIGNGNRIQLSIDTRGRLELWKDNDSTVNIVSSASVLDGQIHHAECDFDGANWYLFLDGNLIGTKAHTCSERNYTFYIGANYAMNRKYTGSIDEFQIYDGVALHTENFTPPTAEDYDTTGLVNITVDIQRNVTNSGTVLADVQRRIILPGEVTIDLQRVITNETNQILVDVQRNVTNSGTVLADVQRAVTNSGAVLVDVQRNVRNVVAGEVAIDIQRRVTNSGFLLADVQRALTHGGALRVDVQRRVSKHLETLADLQRNLINCGETFIDLIRNVRNVTVSERMLSRVSPIYDNSTFMKSFFNALGNEWAPLRHYFTTLREQRFISTVDWGIEYLEHKYSVTPDRTLTLDERRARLGIKAFKKYPLNPAVLEKYARDFCGLEVYLDESDAGFIWIIAAELTAQGYKDFMTFLRREKPAHLALAMLLHMSRYVGTPDTNEPTDDLNLPKVYAGVVSTIRGKITVKLPRLKNESFKIYAGAVSTIRGKISTSTRALN